MEEGGMKREDELKGLIKDVPKAVLDAAPRNANAALYQYAENCGLMLNKDDNTKLMLFWDNGKALKATKGASIDYIAPHLHIHLDRTNSTYSPGDDFSSMTAKGVDNKLALLIVLMRKVVCSMNRVEINQSEAIYVDKINYEIPTNEGINKAITEMSASINTIVQQSVSVLALNGISLISRGHHYNEADQFWTRLENATGLSEQFDALKIGNWRGLIYHDALHVFGYDYVASLVAKKKTGLELMVNGVVLKRLGTMPAGTTTLTIISAMVAAVKMYNDELGNLFTGMMAAINSLIADIREKPLDYCVHFQRTGVAERLEKVAGYELIAVFLYAYLKQVEPKKSTLTSAKSIENKAKQHQDVFILGQQAATAYAKKDMNAAEIKATLARMIGEANVIAKTGKDEE
jgi:hypothetical protein